MPSKSEVTQFYCVILIYEHVVRLDVPVDDAVPVQVGYDRDHLQCYLLPVLVGKIDPLLVDEVEESAFLDQLHH